MTPEGKRRVISELTDALAYIHRTIVAVQADDSEGVYFNAMMGRVRMAQEAYEQEGGQ